MKLIVSFKATIITERHAQTSSVPTDRYALSGETSIKPEERSFKLEKGILKPKTVSKGTVRAPQQV